MSLALGKEVGFVECRTEHSAKSLTWGPSLAGSLPSAAWKTLGKDNIFAECHQGHSAKPPSLSPGVVTAAFLCRVLSGTRQRGLPSAREKALDKECFADALFAEPFFAECHTRQSLCRVFLRLRRVLRSLGKAIDSGSEAKAIFNSLHITVLIFELHYINNAHLVHLILI
jgi:hypothetical protein